MTENNRAFIREAEKAYELVIYDDNGQRLVVPLSARQMLHLHGSGAGFVQSALQKVISLA